MDKTSVPMPHISQLLTSANPNLEKQRKERIKEEQPMRGLAGHPGWVRMRKKFEMEIERLENVQSLFASDTSYEEKGKQAEVNSKAASILRHFVHEVDQYAEEISD